MESGDDFCDGKVLDSDAVGASLPPPAAHRDHISPAFLSKKASFLVFVAFALLATIIGLSVGLLKQRKDNRNVTSERSDSPKSPNILNSPYSPYLNTSPRYSEMVNYLYSLTEPSNFESMTPQNLAAIWIAEDDALELPIPEDYESTAARELIERWTLAVLFYATSGSSWLDRHSFVTEADTCDWAGILVIDTRVHRTGVVCNDDGLVLSLFLPFNNMTGTIPDEVGHLENLILLSFFDNQIFGSLPSSIEKLTDISILAMDHNDITGTFPYWIGSLSKLQVLTLSENKLTGSFPNSVSKLTDLSTLSVDNNFLTGEVSYLNSLAVLKFLHVENNQFSGPLMDGNFSILSELDASNNRFDGPFPSQYLDSTLHPELEVLDLHGNQFKGLFPDEFPGNKALKFLTVHQNNIGGSLANVPLEKLEALTHFDVSSNIFTGDIPPALSSMYKLTFLFLANNSFVPGPVPEFLQSLTELRELSLKDTRRTGTIPSSLGSLDRLLLLDLDSNELVGEVPSELGLLTNLKFLLLNRNNLNGTLPIELEELTSLHMLLLEKNSVTGNADVICNKIDIPEVFIADCGSFGVNSTEMFCSCCHECCDDEDAAPCNDKGLLANYDPIWEFGYNRRSYIFSDEDVWVPGWG